MDYDNKFSTGRVLMAGNRAHGRRLPGITGSLRSGIGVVTAACRKPNPRTEAAEVMTLPPPTWFRHLSKALEAAGRR
jgi:hypothetical protein